MPSKRNRERMEMEISKMISKNPDFLKQFTTERIINNVECGILLGADFIYRFCDGDSEKIEQFIQFCREYFQTISNDKDGDFVDAFSDLNDILKEEAGVGVLGRMLNG